MDISAVENSLKRKVLSPVYLLYGEEPYLRDRLVRKFEETLLPPEVRDFNLDIFDGRDLKFGNLVNAAGTLPFMAEKRLIIVRNADFFKSKQKSGPAQAEAEENGNTDEESLLRYLENPSPSTCLIFLADEGVDKRKKLYKLVEKVGQVVAFPLLKGPELSAWVKTKVNSEGREISSDALQYLQIAVGSNLRMLEQELEKVLTNLGPAAEITLAQVEALVTKQSDITVFQLIDAVAEKRFPAAMEFVHELLFQGEPPPRIVSLLARQFRLIWLVYLHKNTGESDGRIASELQIRPFVVTKCARQARIFHPENLRQALRILLDTDYRIKTGREEPKAALEMAIIRLCS